MAEPLLSGIDLTEALASWFVPDDIDHVHRVWNYREGQMSPLERTKARAEAYELTGCFFDAMHEATGWSGDTVPENFRAVWPLFAIALDIKRQKRP